MNYAAKVGYTHRSTESLVDELHTITATLLVDDTLLHEERAWYEAEREAILCELNCRDSMKTLSDQSIL